MAQTATLRRLRRRAVWPLALLCVALLGGWSRADRSAAQATFAPDLTLLGRLAFPDAHPATEVVVDGRYAYVAYNDARFEGWGLRIVDLINPQAPALVGVYNVPHDPGQTGQVPGIAVQGSYVYLAAGDDGLRVIDVSNRTSPAEVAAYSPSASAYAWDVAVQGSYAYLAAGSEGLRVIDISTPATPTPRGQLASCCAKHVTVVGDSAYLGTSDTLLIVDVSDPTDPALLGSLALSDQFSRIISEIDVAGDVAYVSFGFCLRTCSGGLWTIDVSDPSAPTKLGEEGTTLLRPFTSVRVADGYAFAGVDNGCSSVNNLCSGTLRVIDVHDPVNPFFVAEEQLGTGPSGIDVVGELVYTIDDSPNAAETGARLSILRYTAPLPIRSYLPLITR